ncbi:hypothetical protein AYO41_04560 [Verrucomicrobia bacterium SCGC AG-212-E04]|nr:hypothetical protein AYO41_04560 [Verrucomicrobia bacterium SCGC AG-212-E04]
MLAAAALLVLAHAIGQRHLFALLYDLLERALDAFTWALPLAAVLLLALTIAGCLSQARRPAAIILLLLNVASLIVVVRYVYVTGPLDEQLAFLPPILSLLGCGWLAFSRDRGRDYA